MPSINDRIGTKNVIRVLSNAAAPPLKINFLNDVDASTSSKDGQLLVWDSTTEKYFLTDTIDSTTLVVSGVTTFLNTQQSTSTSTGALVLDGGAGIAKNLNVGENLSLGQNLFVSGVSTLSGRLTLNNDLNVSGISTFTNVTDNVLGDADTGAIQIDGGVGINKNLTVGGSFYVEGTSEFIGNATFRGGTIGIGDGNNDDINVGGEFVSNLVPNTNNTYDLGLEGKRWRDLRLSGLLTATTLYIDDSTTIDGIVTINNNVNVTGFVTVTEGLYYDSDDYDGPNGIAYFDNTGKLIGAASTENAVTETYFILTTNAVGIPTWTSVIDGGVY